MLFSCCNQSNKNKVFALGTIDSTESKDENLWFSCSLSNANIGYEIDSCNCGDVYTLNDSVFISLSQFIGGEIQGRTVKFSNPECDENYFILMMHQNRFYISSMGPDPVLTDWILYNSPFDTIRYNRDLKGFYIDTISEIEKSKFPTFDTLDFYKAYQKAVGENIELDYVPDIAKSFLYREYERFKENAQEVFGSSSAELHRIILILKKGDSTEKVLIFTYDHFG
ncbi:MAG: hypothetical protein R3A43_00225 [Bacteroidia bacterium]